MFLINIIMFAKGVMLVCSMKYVFFLENFSFQLILSNSNTYVFIFSLKELCLVCFKYINVQYVVILIVLFLYVCFFLGRDVNVCLGFVYFMILFHYFYQFLFLLLLCKLLLSYNSCLLFVRQLYLLYGLFYILC